MPTFSPESRAVLKTSMGDITLEFLTDKAPRTCEHFVRLARKGFYEGLTFHRILRDFMLQGGCPKGDGTGGPGFTVRAEFNDTPHVKGVVSMARGNDPHSAGSQFFICHGEARYLDSRYTAFARVVDGLPVVDRIASVPVEENRYREVSKPRDPVFINDVQLEGIEFDASDNERNEPAAPQGGQGQPGQQGQRSESGGRPDPRSGESPGSPAALGGADDDEADDDEGGDEGGEGPGDGDDAVGEGGDGDGDEGGPRGDADAPGPQGGGTGTAAGGAASGGGPGGGAGGAPGAGNGGGPRRSRRGRRGRRHGGGRKEG